MSRWGNLALKSDVPKACVCLSCEHSKGGCKVRSGCADYAAEKFVRELANRSRLARAETEYSLREIARRARGAKGRER